MRLHARARTGSVNRPTARGTSSRRARSCRSYRRPRTSSTGFTASALRAHLGHLVGAPRMTSQPLRGGVDPNDIRADRLFLAAPRQDEMRIVRTGALEIIHHQIAAVGFDCRLEPLDGREQTAKLVRLFRPG